MRPRKTSQNHPAYNSPASQPTPASPPASIQPATSEPPHQPATIPAQPAHHDLAKVPETQTSGDRADGNKYIWWGPGGWQKNFRRGPGKWQKTLSEGTRPRRGMDSFRSFLPIMVIPRFHFLSWTTHGSSWRVSWEGYGPRATPLYDLCFLTGKRKCILPLNQ